MQTVALVDVGLGNIRSVARAIDRAASDASLEMRVEVTRDPDAIARADRVVMPGQGAFRDCAKAIADGVGDALRAQIASGKPYLGICLGLQVLVDESEEAPGARGLGIFPGKVVRLPRGTIDPESGAPVKIPHMGWNRIVMKRRAAGALGAFDVDPPYVYFVHSYHALPTDTSLIAATTEHGAHTVTAAIQRDNVTATQFHPEKSQAPGLLFLAAFLRS